MKDQQLEAAREMHHQLTMFCRCQMHWEKGVLVVTEHCGACRARLQWLITIDDTNNHRVNFDLPDQAAQKDILRRIAERALRLAQEQAPCMIDACQHMLDEIARIIPAQ